MKAAYMLLNKKIILSTLSLLIIIHSLRGQKIVYSEPDTDDNRGGINYEIIGKISGNFLVYKNYKDYHTITVFDNNMKQVQKNQLNFLPNRVLSADFLAFPTFSYMFYQYQKRSIIYSMAVKLDANGKRLSEPVELDTTDVNFIANDKIYAFLFSENKQYIMSYKINNRNDKDHVLKTVLFDANLNPVQKSIVHINMPERNDFLMGFRLDNEGDLVFLKAAGTQQNDNINKLTLCTKKAKEDSVEETEVNTNKNFLDDVTVKVDNLNKKYLLTAFYSKQRRGNVDGLFCYIWDKQQNKTHFNNNITFSDELRNEARGDNSVKAAFNDYYIKNIITRVDGGFILIAEAVYTASRGGNNLSRWDYWGGSPFWGGGPGFYTWGNPWGLGMWGNPWNRWNNFNNITRYYADNIAIISYDSTGKVDWTNIINKSQYDDNSDELIGFTIANTGDKIHFLFNIQERRNLVLTDQYINNDGQITRNPTLKNLDKGYDFMPRHAKQVAAKQIIVPCQYRGYVCFAKIDFN